MISRPGRIARAAGIFTLSSMILLAVSAGCSRGWRSAPTLPPLQPSAQTPPPEVPLGAVRQTAVWLPGDAAGSGRSVRAWILQPAAPPATTAGHPGVVLIPGAGAATRDTLLGEARTLAAAGVAAIVYDKRKHGYTALRRDYRVLADDAVRASDVLRAAPGVDAARIGLLGWSEGGWVAPTAAQRAPESFAFVALASAPIVSPLEQVVWAVRRAVGGPAWLERTLTAALSSGRWFAPYLDFDVEPALSALRVPVWAVWGAADAGVPVNQAVRIVNQQVSGPVAVLVVPGAGHQLPLESGYLQRAAAWIHSLDTTSPSLTAADNVVTGGEPESALGVGQLPVLAWHGHPLLHLALSLTLAIASLAVRPRRHSLSQGIRS